MNAPAIPRAVFDVQAKKEELLRHETDMQRPGFWDDAQRAARVAERAARLKELISAWGKLQEDIGELRELTALDLDAAASSQLSARCEDCATRLRALRHDAFLSGKYDAGGARLSIIAGAGGDDAEDWAAMLFSMYEHYGARRGWSIALEHEHRNERGGIKNIAAGITGAYAYGLLRGEFGVHRLVRISPFSAKKQRHTSFALVEVLPLTVEETEIELKDDDLRMDFARSSGPGGQNVNKRETAVRITHLPTGIQAHVDTERSQQQNRVRALSLLRAKLYQYAQARREEERAALRGGTIPEVAWGHQIRSYVLHPYRMVKDHRTGIETPDADAVLSGELDDFIEAELEV